MRPFRLIVRVVTAMVVVFVATALFWFAAATVKGGVVRLVLAGALGLFLASFGVGFFRQFAAVPPDESPEDVPSELGLVYVCEVCGLELSVIRIARDKPPRHCAEDMRLVAR